MRNPLIIDFEKLNGFGQIGPAPRTVLFCFFEKELFGRDMAHRSLVPSHTPHTTPYSSDIDPAEGPSKPVYGWPSPRSAKQEAWQLPNKNRWPVRRESGRVTLYVYPPFFVLCGVFFYTYTARRKRRPLGRSLLFCLRRARVPKAATDASGMARR